MASIGERFIQVDGLKTRYLEAGAGQSLLLLHGASLGSSADVFAPSLGLLAARGLHAIALDQPGFGGSDKPQDPSVAYRRGFVLSFMNALAMDRPALVGHSQAGRIAVDLAFRHPDRVAAVIVLGTGTLLPPHPQQKAAPQEGEEGGEHEPTPAETRAALEATLYHTELITPEMVEQRHSMSIGENFRAFLERRLTREKAGTSGAPLWQRLHECPVPLLLLYGQEDRGAAAERAMILKGLHPGLDLHVLPQCKHLMPLDVTDAFVEHTARLLERK